jgi:hypothetical protein
MGKVVVRSGRGLLYDTRPAVAEKDKENDENLSGDIVSRPKCSRISQGSLGHYHGNSL